MPSHKSTPRSVFNAPTLTPRMVFATEGLSRAERRGRVFVEPKRRLALRRIRNAPFVGNVRRDLLGLAARVSRRYAA